MTTIVSNAVSFHPVIPAVSVFKIRRLRPLLQPLSPYLNPAWGDEPDSLFARATRAAVNLTHRECDNSVCRQVSFTYGAGRPALWSHANLDADTHEWIRGEFGKVPMSFFAQMDASVRAGHLVSVSRREGLPDDYGVSAPRTDARWVLYAGRNNRCFLPESQERTHRWLEGVGAGAACAARGARVRSPGHFSWPRRGARRVPGDAGRVGPLTTVAVLGAIR